MCCLTFGVLCLRCVRSIYWIVPSVWRESLVVPVPKKQSRGTCVTDNFQGVFVTSSVHEQGVLYATECQTD